MEILSSSSTTIFFSNHQTKINLNKSSSSPHYYTFPISINTQKNKNNKHFVNLSSPLTRTNSTSTLTPSLSSSNFSSSNLQHHWMVLMDPPPNGLHSKFDIINYYVKTLKSVLHSEKDAQMCIYDASFNAQFGFCCDIDEQASHQLARLPGVLSVKADPNFESVKKDYTPVKIQTGTILNSNIGDKKNLFPVGSTKHWLVRMDKPMVGVVTKAQMVDHYVKILTKVMGNETNAQMCIYHVSWQSDFGFCCELDEECADELTGVPGVLTVQLDDNFESEVKNYRGLLDSSEASQDTIIKTKKLFITGLSFYTSEKTLRAAFEEFGEIVEVKIIMDKISKRSKGYAFIEYTTEEAAGAALVEMNNKIINGWMIVVDVAKVTPPKFSRGRPRPTL